MRAAASAWLALIRWENALLAAAGVLLGAWWAGAAPTGRAALLAAGAAVALAMVANAFNDYCDVEIDRVAHPERPLPSGALSRRIAAATTAVGALVALALSWAVRPALAAATAVVVALMLAYSWRLKATGLPGNATVAVLASLPFLYGAWAAGEPAAAWPLVALAVPLHLARELAKDLEDAPGDALARRTVPVARGAPAARRLVIGALAAFALALTAFAVRHPLAGLAASPALLLCAIAAHRVMASRRGSPLLLKSAMVCAMAGLLIGRGT